MYSMIIMNKILIILSLFIYVLIGGIIGYSAYSIVSFWQSQIETQINNLFQPDYPAAQVR